MISALALFSAYRNPRQSLGKRCSAFDDTMIHGELQFTRLITVCHDLHRRRSLGIHFTYSNVGRPDTGVPDQLSHPRSPLPWERGSGSSHSSIVPDEEPRVTGAVQPPVVNPVPKQSGIVVTPAEHQNARPAHRQTARSFSNDPSAGSPTKTLLRLLLPTNKKVQ